MNWRGIYPAAITPFDEKGEIDFPAIERLVEFLEDGGVRGVYALGTTGEFPHLSGEERLAVAKAVAAATDKLNVIINVGDLTTEATIRNAKNLENVKGISAVAAIAPYYFNLTQEQIVLHYRALSENTSFPIFLYYIPQMTKVKISMAALKEIAALPNFAGLKDSSHDINWYADAMNVVHGKCYLTGSDALIHHFLNAGSDGAVAATACVAPRLLGDLMKAFDRGDMEESKRLQKIVCRLRLIIKKFPALSGFKALLEIQGICKRFMRSPLTELSDGQMHEIKMMIAEDSYLSQYFSSNYNEEIPCCRNRL